MENFSNTSELGSSMPEQDIFSNTSELWAFPTLVLDVFFNTNGIGVKSTCSAESGTEYSVMHVPSECFECYDS